MVNYKFKMKKMIEKNLSVVLVFLVAFNFGYTQQTIISVNAEGVKYTINKNNLNKG